MKPDVMDVQFSGCLVFVYVMVQRGPSTLARRPGAACFQSSSWLKLEQATGGEVSDSVFGFSGAPTWTLH